MGPEPLMTFHRGTIREILGSRVNEKKNKKPFSCDFRRKDSLDRNAVTPLDSVSKTQDCGKHKGHMMN